MDTQIVLIIFGIIIIIIVILYFVKKSYTVNNEDNSKGELNEKINKVNERKKMINIGYKRNPSNFMMNTSLQTIYAKHSIIPITDNINAKKIIYMPSAYDFVSYEISLMEKTKGNYYYIINLIDLLVGKDFMWDRLYQYYRNDVTKLSPKSYIPRASLSLERLKKDYSNNKLYIAKKNIQRQEGIQIINDKDELFKLMYDKEVAIIQELLQDPMTINGHKINLRVYILIMINNNVCNVYVYNDGFMYYTPKKFVVNSVDKDVNITTGYIDRKIYEENPLTHKDFMEYLDRIDKISNENSNENSIYVKYNILNLIKNVLKCYTKSFVENQAFKGSVQYQIMGADVAINNKGKAQIMEINKGPDLGGKDERDTKLKCTMVEHMLEIVGILPMSDSNEFIKII
jgi:hypothetical protein